MVAFHARSVWPDDELGALMAELGRKPRLYIRSWDEDKARLNAMLAQMSPAV
jgi:hypothetical protein